MARERPTGLTHAALTARKSWKPLPAVAALHGDADFFKREIEARFIRELFPEGTEPQVRRFAPSEKQGPPPLAEVLDELRTPSFFAPNRLVVVERADEFVAAHREVLEPLVERGFAGGHLVLLLDSLDLRTRLAKTVAEKGWAVECRRPFDRPPPWQPEADPWDNELARWVQARARGMKLSLDLETAFGFCERVGNDLATLAEELEKLRSYLGPGERRVGLEEVNAVTGELREDSVFDLVDAFLAADRPAALRIAGRLLRSGYHPPRGAPVLDPGAIWSLFLGALLVRLRSLRRAHALSASGRGPDEWVALRLTPKPFLPRFQRDLNAAPAARIERALEALRALDRGVKTGAQAQHSLETFLIKY